ncbi:MAG TPA: trigger factor [Gaiellaceae bacterium]|nr:trigger factor [Gaiellaceae bacterium]
MKTKVEELPESRVRLDVEVPEADLKHAFEHAASDMAASLRLPGFRQGKAPLPVVVARVGREAIWQEALKSHLDSWFWSAAENTGIRPVATPEVEFEGLPADDEPFKFSATVAVLPRPEVTDWTELEVPAAEPDIPADVIDQELERIRETAAELVRVDGRAAMEGDTVVIDLAGEGLTAQRDYVVEVGADRLVPELDEALVGMSAGETKTVELAGAGDQKQDVALTVKDVQESVLPELDDDLAQKATEFDTLAELRADIEGRLREQLEEELNVHFREAAVDALVDSSQVETVAPLVERRTAELWSAIARSLERRGISTETYLTMTGQSAEDVVARLRAEAERSLQRELVLDAVAAKLGIEVADEEIDELIREQTAEGDDPEEATRLLRESGGYEKLRADLRLKKALDEIAAGVKKIPVDLARAREKLWTPEKEKGSKGMNIWTPSSEEAR